MDINMLKDVKFDQESTGGYDIEQVDRFIQDIMKEFENQDRQMTVLASKLQDYREDENSLKTILLNAQKLADSTVKEAKQRAEIILRDARIKSETLVEKTAELREKEEEKLNTLKGEISDFKISILKMYKNHIEAISSIPEYSKDEISETDDTDDIDDIDEGIDYSFLEDSDDLNDKMDMSQTQIFGDAEEEKTEDAFDGKSSKFDFSDLSLEDEFTQI